MILTTCACGFQHEGIPAHAKPVSGTSPFAGFTWPCRRCSAEMKAPREFVERYLSETRPRLTLVEGGHHE